MFQNGLLWGQAGPLFEENDEANGGGGGNGAGDEGSGEGAGDGEADKPITMATLTQLLTSLKGDLTKQVNALDKKLKQSTQQAPAAKEKQPAEGKKKQTPFEDDEKEELRNRLEQLETERQTERATSLNKERDADIKAALSEFPWKEADDRGIAFDYYRAKAERDEDGNLMIDGVELGEYIKKHVPKRFKGMLAAREVGGSGNSNNNKSGKAGALDLSEIKPGMSAETDAKARETILGLYAAARAGQQ